MLFVQFPTVGLLKRLVLFHGVQTTEGEVDFIHLITFIIDRAHGCNGRISIISHATTIGLIDAHHLESHLPHLDVLSYESLITCRHQFFGIGITEDDNLSFFPHVDIVDEAPAEYRLTVDRNLLGMNATQRYLHVFGTKTDLYATLTNHHTGSRHVLTEVVRGGLKVFLVQLDASSFAQPFVCLAGDTAMHTHRLIHKPSGRVLQGINQSVAGTQQEDEHEDSPCNSESRQSGT